MLSAEKTGAQILDGRAVAEKIKHEVAEEGRRLGIKPCLAAVLVGDDEPSAVYVRNKVRACAEVGIASDQHVLPAATTAEELLALVRELNQREDVDGILVQLPLPKQIDEALIIEAVDPRKDVDASRNHRTARAKSDRDRRS
jgi:methylenetetrahydrofolate dehydrogenase (NADP+)/methenyltetrahydrofolate cyclohydrolase